MVFIIGGLYSGRHGYARELMLEWREEGWKTLDIDRRFLDSYIKDPDEALCDINDYDIVIGQELGEGGIAMGDGARLQKANGQLNQAIAKRAQRVYRMVCGIPIIIKPCPW